MKVHDQLREVMKRKKSWKSYDLQKIVKRPDGSPYSESTITRRLREMKEAGLVKIERSKKKGETSWDYKLTEVA